MPSLSQFIASRREGWLRLESLLSRTEGNGLRAASEAELDELGRRYREAVSDLAVASRDFPEDEVTHSLNALVARAHLRLYRAPGASWKRIGRFFWTDFARRFRAAGRYIAGASALFFLPAIWAYLFALLDPTIRDILVPRALARIMERGETWTEMEAAVRPYMATAIFTNNLQVSFIAFAGGVFFGLGTTYILIMNGLSIGGILGAAQYYGVAHLLWGFVSSHGYLEITSILIAGGAGLMLGDALLRPGFERRRDALTRAARQAFELVAGAAPVFVLAGLVEGFISPSEALPAQVKYLIGPLFGLAMWATLLTIGREPRPNSRRRAFRNGSSLEAARVAN